jgi:hypothetical protein
LYRDQTGKGKEPGILRFHALLPPGDTVRRAVKAAGCSKKARPGHC